MKRLIFIFALAHAFNLLAQERYAEKNELRLNPIYLFGTNSVFPEVSYERTLSHRSALGLSVGFLMGLEDKFNYVDDFISHNFSVLPYYRHYFGKKPARGFFIEGNSIILLRESFLEDGDEWKLGIGLGIGAKFEIRNSWSIGFVLGGGTVFEQQNESNAAAEAGVIAPSLNFPNMYPRLGITIGKWF